jgi:hypothetical protein
MSADKIALRDRCRVKDSEHVSYLEHIAANDKSGAVRVAAIRELFDQGHGRCLEPIDGDGQGGPIVIRVVTRVPGRTMTERELVLYFVPRCGPSRKRRRRIGLAMQPTPSVTWPWPTGRCAPKSRPSNQAFSSRLKKWITTSTIG